VTHKEGGNLEGTLDSKIWSMTKCDGIPFFLVTLLDLLAKDLLKLCTAFNSVACSEKGNAIKEINFFPITGQ
jgi:hypothetical protein